MALELTLGDRSLFVDGVLDAAEDERLVGSVFRHGSCER